MKITVDNELKGVGMVFDGMLEILESAQKQDPKAKTVHGYYGQDKFNSWSDVMHKSNRTWSEGIETVQRLGEEIAKSSPPQPVSIRRQRRWSEDNGDLDVDRVLGNSETFFRESYRVKRPQMQNVVLFCDVSAGCFVRERDLFYRSAAVIAAIDILEESGYRCEVWAYDIGRQCYLETENHHSFIAYRVKGLSDVLDVDGVAKCLSPWFFRTALFANYDLGGKVAEGKGYATTEARERWFGRHCDVDGTMEQIWMPSATNLYDSVKAVKGIIEKIETM